LNITNTEVRKIVTHVLHVADDVLTGAGSASHSEVELAACKEAAWVLFTHTVELMNKPQRRRKTRQLARALGTAAETMQAVQIADEVYSIPVAELFTRVFGATASPNAIRQVADEHASIMAELEPLIERTKERILRIEKRKAQRVAATAQAAV
jgi:hypothetical protein